MNPKRILTVEEVIEFFSHTHEFQVEKYDEHHLKIIYIDSLIQHKTSVLMYIPKINIQQLIRTVSQLTWNACNNIID